MTAFLLALAGVLLGFALGRWRQGITDNQGEAAVRRKLGSRFASPDYHLLNNVTLPVAGGTTQVDHILVSRFGVFVIETKHYKGWLFANHGAPKWTQVLHKQHYKFQNPIHQNRKHVGAVVKLLEFLPAEVIHSVVVFSGDARFKTPKPDGVFSLRDLPDHIAGHKTELLSANRVQFCVGRLECCRKALTRQTDIEHIAHLHRKFGDAG